MNSQCKVCCHRLEFLQYMSDPLSPPPSPLNSSSLKSASSNFTNTVSKSLGQKNFLSINSSFSKLPKQFKQNLSLPRFNTNFADKAFGSVTAM